MGIFQACGHMPVVVLIAEDIKDQAIVGQQIVFVAEHAVGFSEGIGPIVNGCPLVQIRITGSQATQAHEVVE
ncbi:hypothetical protein GCM10023155_41280 [Bremerella cremea]